MSAPAVETAPVLLTKSAERVRAGREAARTLFVAEAARKAEQDRSERVNRIKNALHAKYELTPDQTITDISAYNTQHANRDGSLRPGGGEMVVRVAMSGQSIEGLRYDYFEINNNNRGGLEEDTIADLGMLAREVPTVERVILAERPAAA